MVAEHCPLGRILAIWVAGLDHEVGYDTMEQKGIIKVVLTDQFQKVVAMQRRFVIQFHPDVAHRGFYQYLRAHITFCNLGTHAGADYKKQTKK